MATIRASWRRTVQVKKFESETLELAVEQEIAPDADTVKSVQDLDRALSGAGDVLILERLQLRVTEATEPDSDSESKGVDFAAARQRVRKPEGREAPPNPAVIETVKRDAPAAETTEPDGADDDYLNAQ